MGGGGGGGGGSQKGQKEGSSRSLIEGQCAVQGVLRGAEPMGRSQDGVAGGHQTQSEVEHSVDLGSVQAVWRHATDGSPLVTRSKARL